MKTKIIIAVFFILIAMKANAFGGGHDSLLFDGSGEVIIIPSNFSDDCKIKVTKVSGFVVGTRVIKEIYTACGQDTIKSIETAVQLKASDNIVKKEEIKTGADGFVKMELTDGSVIILGPNSSIYIDEEMCETARTLIRFNGGSLWTKVKKLIGGGKFEVSDKLMAIGVRGTEFSVETNSEKSVVKVYEGSVEVKKNMDTKGMDQTEKEMEKLSKDYEEGKITIEELSAKMTEITGKANESLGDMEPVMVVAGFMVTVTGKKGTPELIPTGETKWFEDARIK